MKKLLANFLVGGFIALSTMPAFAYQGIEDVAQNYRSEERRVGKEC